jgi:hypothetical protein
MSNVLRPRGRLPGRIYWTRRLLVLILVLILVLAVRWLGTRGDDAAATGDLAAGRDPGGPTATTPVVTTTPPPPTSTGHQVRRRVHPQQPTGPAGTTAPPTTLATPSGPCDPAKVGLTIVAANSVLGHRNAITFALTSEGAEACILAVTPGTVEARILSGGSVVWSSAQCPDGFAARQVVVRAQPGSSYTFTWDGRKSTPTCAAGTVAPAGHYLVEAALLSGEPVSAGFDVKPPGGQPKL